MREKFKNLKSEFKKIIWPNKKQVNRETLTVISASILIAGCIGLVDMCFKFLVGLVF